MKNLSASTRFTTISFEIEENQIPFEYKGRKFFIDIQIDNEEQCYDIWLYAKNIGIKDYLFGLPIKQQIEQYKTTLQEIIEIVEENLEYEDYIYWYMEKAEAAE